MRLSICIPTYNRLSDLRACLALLVPQIAALSAGVAEVVIIDNASTDGTADFINALPVLHRFFKVFHNPTNLGFDGNTVECIMRASGDYTALLSDDDRYLDGAVATLLDIVGKQDYALINLNYYSYSKTAYRPAATFAPQRSILFERAYDILNHRSVGHFSGFVYNSRLAKRELSGMLAAHPLSTTGRSREIYLEVAARIAANSSLPAYFVGTRKLATYERWEPDDASVGYGEPKIRDICLNCLALFHRLYAEAVITEADLHYRERLVVTWLPGMVVRNAPLMTERELDAVTRELRAYFPRSRRFRFTVLPLLLAARFQPTMVFYRLAHRVVHPVRRHFRRRKD